MGALHPISMRRGAPAKRVLALMMALTSFPARGAEVQFVRPDSYIDPTFERPRSKKNQAAVQEGLRKAFGDAERAYLPPGHTLAIEVTGIDLAGALEPTFAGGDIRVMRPVSWPRLQFSYKVKQDGVIVAEGQADIHNPNYLDEYNTRPPGERLRYERAMLSDWFKRTFRRPTPAHGTSRGAGTF